MARPTRALINLASLRHNASEAARLAPEAALMAVVKADAYGHGAIDVASTLAPQVDAFAVAAIEEACALRQAGIGQPVLLLEGVFQPAELALAAELDFTVTVTGMQQLAWLEAANLPRAINCWLKIDTGMHRLGIAPQEAQACYARLVASPNVGPAPVLCTHFARADEPVHSMTTQQLAVFSRVSDTLKAPRSAANSPALLSRPDSHFDWVRPGYMLYGNSPFAEPQPNAANLRPVMTLVSAVISVRRVPAGESVGYGGAWQAQRDSVIATVTAGYGDGYPRNAVAGTPVLVNGIRAPLAGRVSMDMLTVDVTDLPEVVVGDPVELWGPDLPAGEVAAHAGTIGYELLTRLPKRVPREYLNR